MVKSTWSRLIRTIIKPKKTIIILLPCFLTITIYLLLEKYINFKNYLTLKEHNALQVSNDNEYLVWNSKCHMLSYNPMDPWTARFVKKEKYESCSSGPLLSSIEKESDGTFSLVINQNVAEEYDEFNCCWTPINRPIPTESNTEEWDNKINIGHCEDFEDRVTIPQNIEIVLITCRPSYLPINFKPSRILYQNVHAIINPVKVKNTLSKIQQTKSNKQRKKLSVLIMGLDSVSRLNFHRTMPKTLNYLHETGWYDLKGYNKIGDNTLPNLLAILTGQNQDDVTKECKLKQEYGSDGCPFIWNNFKDAGYITAYGEDIPRLGTFNYKQDGFINPPTDYYLRPYILASEKLLKSKKKFNFKYCIGPESAVDRIFNYAINFSKTFINKPYFGFFWSNTITHDDMNGLSSMDDYFLDMFKEFDEENITNDTILFFISDHGVRWGDILDNSVGWHENRLPFIFMKFPTWMKDSDNLFRSLRLNEDRLTSPYDIYETLREILIKAGGNIKASSACPNCQSLLKPVPSERGCDDAGISTHWCTCNAFEPDIIEESIVEKGTEVFNQHIENVAKTYIDDNGNRLCAKLKVDEIIRANKIIEFKNKNNQHNNVDKYFFTFKVKPGGGKFDVTIMVRNGNKFSMLDSEINRIDSYEQTSRCVDYGFKWFCHCL